jgi:alpha-ribazole phosphatase
VATGAQAPAALVVWRHPEPIGAAGLCIGHTDLPVDSRKAKRLAHRIRRYVRQNPAVFALHPQSKCQVYTSPLRRGADVGRWLKRWGWRHHTDAALMEMDFGAWDGLTWEQIGEPAVTAWCAEFSHYADHGGETLAALFDRCQAWAGAAPMQSVRCVVGHAGWINAARLLSDRRGLPAHASEWPAAVKYGQRLGVF